MFREVGVGPAMMIGAASTATKTPSLAQDRSQPHTDPAIDVAKGGVMSVLEVFVPATQLRVYPSDNLPEAAPVCAVGFRS